MEDGAQDGLRCPGMQRGGAVQRGCQSLSLMFGSGRLGDLIPRITQNLGLKFCRTLGRSFASCRPRCGDGNYGTRTYMILRKTTLILK